MPLIGLEEIIEEHSWDGTTQALGHSRRLRGVA